MVQILQETYNGASSPLGEMAFRPEGENNKMHVINYLPLNIIFVFTPLSPEIRDKLSTSPLLKGRSAKKSIVSYHFYPY
jgi:hypothetical protein